MMIPKTFMPDNLSEERLEKLLEGPRKVERYNPLKHEFYCDICGKLAGSIEIIFEKKNSLFFWPSFDIEPKSAIVIKNFPGTVKIPMYEESLELIISYLEGCNLKAILKKLNDKNLDFYCPTCDKCYCRNHRKNHLEK